MLGKLTKVLYESTARDKYTCIRKSIQHLTSDPSLPQLKSHYTLTKPHRVFEGDDFFVRNNVHDINADLSNEDNQFEDIKVLKEEEDETKLEDIAVKKLRISYYSSIKDGFKNCLDIMMIKHTLQECDTSRNIGLMNCFDGANHLVTKYGHIPVLSFNSKLCNRDIVLKTSTTASQNIFTWQQAMAK